MVRIGHDHLRCVRWYDVEINFMSVNICLLYLGQIFMKIHKDLAKI